MGIITVERIAELIEDAPGWALVALTMPQEGLREAARHEVAIQTAVVSEAGGKAPYSDETELHGPDLANALLFALATILEPSPSCDTPAGMRKMAEAVGKELHQLMKETRQLKAMPIGSA